MDAKVIIAKLVEAKHQIEHPSFSNAEDARFIIWKDEVKHLLGRFFGDNSKEVEKLESLTFERPSNKIYFDVNAINYWDRKSFNKDQQIASAFIDRCIEMIEERVGEKYDVSAEAKSADGEFNRGIFISHAVADGQVVESLFNLLEDIGIGSDEIFCSSYGDRHLNYGANFYDELRVQLESNSTIFFIITDNFNNSKMCVMEVGAAWILGKKIIPIVVPPLQFSDMPDYIKIFQGLKVDNVDALNKLKDQLIREFELAPLSQGKWERRRKAFLKAVGLPG